MLYAPMRVVIYEAADGAVHLSIDQPSTRFGSFGNIRIAEVGTQLDAKLADLLPLLGPAVPRELDAI